MLVKLSNLVRQEEAFNRSRRPGEPQPESKKRPHKEVAYDSGDEAEVIEFIDRLLQDDDIIVSSEGNTANLLSPKHAEKDDRAKRPPNWRLIAQHFESYGTASTTANFPEVLKHWLCNFVANVYRLQLTDWAIVASLVLLK